MQFLESHDHYITMLELLAVPLALETFGVIIHLWTPRHRQSRRAPLAGLR